jgi:hypothetical protein
MKQFKHPPLLFFLAALLIAACGPRTTAPNTNSQESAPRVEAAAAETPAEGLPASDLVACRPAQGETANIDTARLFVEYNATDEDLGIHGGFDADGWSELCIYAPNGDQILGVKPQSQLGDLTVATIFFEGREPEISEFSFDDLAANFPEGQYAMRALSFDGMKLAGSATFSHNYPAPPTITSPELAEDAETAGDALVSTADLVIEWEDVTETVDGRPVAITGYEVIVTKEEHDDPHGFSRPIFDVHVPPDRRALSVPAEFLEPGTVYELEVLALEESGNQTITVGFFETG